MGRALLTLALAGALLAALAGACARAPALARTSSCVRCHGTHYAALGTCVECHRGEARATRPSVAHERLLRGDAAAWRMPGSPALAEGERLRDALGCRRCHVTGGRGNAWAIALDRVAWRRDQERLRASIEQPASFMPDFSLSPRQADRLIAVLLRDAERGSTEERYLVRFRDRPVDRAGAYVTYCGPCHRALTRSGPLGTGSSGPNLTGLLTPYYPSADGRAWDRERLARGVRNPRAGNRTAAMPPVRMRDDELSQVIETLAAPPPR